MLKKIALFMLVFIFLSSCVSSFNWKDADIRAYYDLDEPSGVVIDSSNNQNATNVGATTQQPGIINYSYFFVETETDFINLTTSNNLIGSNPNAFSINVWFNTNATDDSHIISTTTGAGIPDFLIRIDNQQDIIGSIYNGTATTTVEKLGTYNDENWHMVTFVVSKTLDNATLYVDGVYAGSDTLPETSTDYTTDKTFRVGGYNVGGFLDGYVDEVMILNRTLSSSEVVELWNNGNGLGFNQNVVLLNSPDDNSVFYNGESVVFNCTGEGGKILNLTLFIDGVANYTVTNTTANQKNISLATTNVFETLGSYDWWCVMYDSGFNQSVNRTFTVNDYVENSLTYSSPVLELTSQTITINISKESLSSAVLNYNGTNYSVSILTEGSDGYIISSTVTLPSVSTGTNLTFYFIIDGVSSTLNNQTVYPSFLDDCSAYSYELINVSLFDEISLNKIKGDLEILYELLNVPFYDVIASQNLSITNTSSVKLCSNINLSEENVVYSMEIRYSSDGYKYAGNDSYNFTPELYHIQKAEGVGVAQVLNLYSLRDYKSTEFKITYQDNQYDFVEGAVIQLLRKYIGEAIYRVVEAPITSNEGTTTLHVDLSSNKYKIIVVKDGVVLDTFDNLVFSCDSLLTGDCKQKLLGDIDPQNIRNIISERDFNYSITSDNDSITVTFTVPSLLPALVNVQLNQLDQFGNETLCNKTLTSSAGSIECGFNDTLGDTYLVLKIYKDGKPMGIHSYIIPESNGVDFLDNNYIIVVILMLSLVGMALTSPEWIVINAIITLSLSGMLWLVNGLNFVMGLGLLMWLVIGAGIIIIKLSKQEDR